MVGHILQPVPYVGQNPLQAVRIYSSNSAFPRYCGKSKITPELRWHYVTTLFAELRRTSILNTLYKRVVVYARNEGPDQNFSMHNGFHTCNAKAPSEISEYVVPTHCKLISPLR